MTSRIGGSRRKSRYRLQKRLRQKGKIGLTKFFAKYQLGDRVILKAEPGYQNGMFYPKFQGATGTVIGETGRCYYVRITDGDKTKTVITHPVHIKRA